MVQASYCTEGGEKGVEECGIVIFKHFWYCFVEFSVDEILFESNYIPYTVPESLSSRSWGERSRQQGNGKWTWWLQTIRWSDPLTSNKWYFPQWDPGSRWPQCSSSIANSHPCLVVTNPSKVVKEGLCWSAWQQLTIKILNATALQASTSSSIAEVSGSSTCSEWQRLPHRASS